MGRKRRSRPPKKSQQAEGFYHLGKPVENCSPERETNPEFNNPYQFVPARTERTPTLKWAKPEDIRTSGNRFVRHDYWHDKGLSGKVSCELKTLTPTMIGGWHQPCRDPDKNNKNDKGDPAFVHPYILPDNEENRKSENQKPMIPANSLRGMVASIAETISQSSLRVLDVDKKFSVRHEMEDYLPELGILFRIRNDDSSYYDDYIYPLQTESFGNYRKPEHPETQVLQASDCFQFEHNFNDPNAGGRWLYIRGQCEGFPTERDGKTLKKRYEKRVTRYGQKHRELRLRFRPEGKVLVEDCVRVKTGLVEEFQSILQQRYLEEPDFCHLPKGYKEHKGRMKVIKDGEKAVPVPHVLDGDLVFYRKSNSTVIEMAYSQIWRKPVSGSVGTAFALENNDNLNALPWSVANKRSALTPAEWLFGVVEDNPEKIKQEFAKNLSSRLRFSDAKSRNISYCCSEPKILKILNSPSPPSPSMYFSAKMKNGLSKKSLDLTKHKPNGRKQYIPHPEALRDKPEYHWESRSEERQNMRMRCRPLNKDVTFTFDIQFENLSPVELELLLRSLTPSDNYVHRIGLGKPLGLGHVKLSVTDIVLRNRKQRYTPEGLDSDNEQSFNIDGIYPYLKTLATTEEKPLVPLVNERALKHICALNDVDLQAINSKRFPPVCYPFLTEKEQSAYNEEKGFAWFEKNDDEEDNHRQNLKRLWETGEVPTLKS
ncbi:MAG: TIGR03986 family CRISPR-associated RAMP protein [Gammaproteobacteria bacterium]|nr:MAG: TIGR03986 family CRISPR-associated RAMP protein [Gammaproteobacteria bacterium]